MRRALLVGIDDHPGAPLSGCVNDARALGGVLRRHEDGAPNFDCVTLTAPPSGITRAALLEGIEQLFAHEADVALLYFSGHGTENNLGGHLVTPDARRYSEGASMTEVLTLANNSPAQEVIIMLDCCHSGALGAVPAIDGANTNARLREGVSILTASRSAQAAVEIAGRGLFTSLVCGALEGGAANVIGDVTAASVYAYVDQSLGPWDQRPLFKGHVSKLTSLRRCKPLVAPATLRMLPQWFPRPDAEYALDPSYEPAPNGQPKAPEERHAEHERIFRCLQDLRDAKLVVPVGEEHMYYAAMNRKACRLTPLGVHYWQLANGGRV